MNANFDDKSTTLTTNAKVGQKDQTRILYVPSLTNATVLSLRTIAWTQTDDQEVRIFFVRGTADAANRLLAATLTVDNGDTTFLGDQTVTVADTSGGAGAHDSRTGTTAATANAHGDFRNATPTATDAAVRVRLLKGVRYRLTMSVNAGTETDAMACLQLRTVRRGA